MSILDELTERRTDVTGIIRKRERLIVCPADKRPADYLMLDDIERVTLFISIFAGHTPKSRCSYSNMVSDKILDYLYSVPNIYDLSTAVLVDTDDVRYDLLFDNYERMLFKKVKYHNFNNWILMVSFHIDIRSYYSMMKLIRGLHMCYLRFSFALFPVVRFDNEDEDAVCFIKFDDEFMGALGIKDYGRVPSMVPGYVLMVMCRLARLAGLLGKSNEDEDADKVRMTDEIERWSVRLKRRHKK